MEIRALAGSTGLLADLLSASGVGDTSAGRLPTKGTDDISDAFGLGRDDFFKLFLSQLANQDPMNPVSDKEFINQLAQFTMIDALQAVKTALAGTQLAEASGLIGRSIAGVDIAGAAVDGVVDRVVQADGRLLLMVGDRAVSPEDVMVVEAAPSAAGAAA